MENCRVKSLETVIKRNTGRVKVVSQFTAERA